MKVSAITILILVGMISLINSEITPRFPGTQPIIIDGTTTTGTSNSTSFEDKVIVDAFSTPTASPLVITLSSNAPPAVTSSSFQQSSNILGGERDIILTVSSGSTGKVTTADVSNGRFSLSCPTGASGQCVIQYDGVDSSSSLSLNPGLGGLDFTANQAVGFRVSASSDISTQFSITVYSGNGASGTVSQSVVGDASLTSDYLILFSKFSSSVDFTDVVAVVFTVNGAQTVDFFLNTFVTYGNVSTSIGAAQVTGSVLPCDYDYYRIETLTNLTPGDYLKISFNQTGETGYVNNLGTLYVVSSEYTDLQAELASNTNIVDTLGQLPGPNNYLYKCNGSSCDIEITSCQLQDTTYYLAVAGSDAGILNYSIDVYLRSAPIYQLFAQTPQPIFLDQRPASPNDHTLYYRYYAIDIPESLYSEGSYLVVNISRAEPYPGLEMSLNYGGLPESSANTGVIGQTDYNSDGEQVDNCIYQYCVNTARSTGEPYYENPVASQPRVPCTCTTTIQVLVGQAFQLTCNLTVDPCQFQYGTWYVAVLLPAYSTNTSVIDTANYTLTPYLVQPSITSLFRNVTFKGSVVPEKMSHYKIDVPASEMTVGGSHLIVQVSNVRNGYIDVWVHQGLGGNNNLAGGPEACVPANATCNTRDACNVVIEKCHFTPGTWYIGIFFGYTNSSQTAFSVFDSDRLPITYTLRAQWVDDATPTPILAGVPVFSSIGEALYDFYVIDIPQTIDTWLFIELYSRCQDTEVILSVLHGALPGGECYERPDFYCLTGDPRDTKYTTGPPTNLDVVPVQRQSCTFMIQTCELTSGPLYLSVYGHHQNYAVYGDTTFYQIPVQYTLYVDFDTATPLVSGVSYADNVVNYQYQHYYIRADQVKQGSYLTVEVTNILHGVPQTIETFVNYNYLAGNCPCYDHLYNCTGAPKQVNAEGMPIPACIDTFCNIFVPPSDFRSGVWYIAVLGVNQDSTQYTTPIGYTLTVTIHDPPSFIPLLLGQAETATVPQWNKSLEYTHFKIAASPIPLNDLVIKLTYVQDCDYLGKHDNLRDTLVMYARADGPATELGYDFTCSAKIQSESYCTIVVPQCEWTSSDFFVAVKGDYDATFIGRFTIRAYLEEIRDFELTSGIYTYDQVPEGTYKHYFIESDGVQTKHLHINVYTNQDVVSVYLNLDGRAGTLPCYTSTAACVNQSICSWVIDASDLVAGRYYVSVFGENQWYDSAVEFTVVAEFKRFATILASGNPFTNHVLVGEMQHYRYTIEEIQVGDYLVVEVDNVDFGSVAVYLNYGTGAGRCPSYLNDVNCYASYDNVEWCEVRVPSCELQLGDYYITVVGLESLSPCNSESQKIGYVIELNQVTPLLRSPEVDVGRDTTNTLVLESLENDNYAHYQFRYTADDYAAGNQIIVEINNVQDGALYVYYNKGMPSDYDTACQLAQICTNGLSSGDYCYWQIPFSLSKPTFLDANETILEFQYITVLGITGMTNVNYNILIWKEPPASIAENTLFTLDNVNSSYYFPSGVELNITHFSQDEPNNWNQFIKLTNVPANTEGDLLELFFYRIINNVAQPTSFNVYVFPEVPAGAHECCSNDPTTLGSCLNGPTLRTVDLTSNGVFSHTCSLSDGVGYDTTGTEPFFGERCTVQVWPCTFSRYCQNASTWWVSVIPIESTDPQSAPLPGLSYSLQWRVRNIMLDETLAVNSVSLTNEINTYNYTEPIPVVASTTEDEGWLSLYFDVLNTTTTTRISVQTVFVNGSGEVYIYDSFASAPDTCNFYSCSSENDCAGADRFISNECHTSLYSRYYITVRNTFGANSTIMVQFRIVEIVQPATVIIPSHLTPLNPYTVTSSVFTPFNVTGIEGENYDTYVMPIDDKDFADHQYLLIDVQRPTVDSGSLELYIRYGAQAGDSSEGCYSWLYSCSLPEAGSRCLLQIPHKELIEGYWYISLYNPDFLYNGNSTDLPDYNMTVYFQDAPANLTLDVPFIVNDNGVAVEYPGTYVTYRVNVTTAEIGWNGGVTNGTSYSSDYYTSYLRFTLTGVNGNVTMYINYDDVAGEVTTDAFNPYGYYQESLTYIDKVDCTDSDCVVDILPCDNNFKLISGSYYISLLIESATVYNLTATVNTNFYQILSPQNISGTGDRAGTSNILWSHASTSSELLANGDGSDYYRYTVDTTANLPNDFAFENNYFFVNITVNGTTNVNAVPLSLEVWRDDCSIFECVAPLTSVGSTWCAIDALSLAPCSIKGGRFYFNIYNPSALPFTLYFYQNETTIQELLNEQVITEIVYPYEYQEYYFEAVDVLEGATLTVRVCADCGEVETWIRPSFPAGPGPDGTGYATSCGLDHCSISSSNNYVEISDDYDLEQCCTMFLDTCQFTQQGYYIGVRGVGTTFPNSVNEHLYLPARYSIQAIQTNLKINEMSFTCPSTVTYDVTPAHVPQQFAIDLESANVGSMLRFTLVLPDASVYVPAELEYATLSISRNRTVGYTTQCSNSDFSCSIASTDSVLRCDFVVPADSVYTGRYYLWADAPRGSQVIVERWDPYIPIIQPNLLYTTSINGPDTGYIFDGPFRPNTQYYRFDLQFDDDDFDNYDETFFLRVLIKDVKHGSLSASLNSGYFPLTASSSNYPTPLFMDNLSCSIATDGYDCHIDLELCQLASENSNYDGNSADDDDDNQVPSVKTFWITVTGLQQLAELHSIQYSLMVQTNWEFTYFPLDQTICNNVVEGDYNFHRLRPHAKEYPQQSILRVQISDIDVDSGDEVEFYLKDHSVPTEDCFDLAVRSGRAVSSNSAIGLGEINVDWICSYDNLYLSVFGVNSASGSVDYKMNVTRVPVKVKELFNNNVYHADDDDDDACGSVGDVDQDYSQDFYIFKAVAANYSTSFLRVAVDSAYPFKVYLNKGGFAYEECHIAYGSADSGTVNLYDFCEYENTYYFITVVSEGPYYIYTNVRDDAKELTLGEVYRDQLEQGSYQMYTLKICEDWYDFDDRLVVEIADVQNAGVYGWIQLDSNPGAYQYPSGDGVCDITGTSAFAQFGAGLSGYDYIMVDQSQLNPGTYHILIQAQSLRESVSDDVDILYNPQYVSFRLFPYLDDLDIVPYNVTPNTVALNQVVDLYNVARYPNFYPNRINYYAIAPLISGYKNGIAFAQVRVQNVQGGLVTVRVSSGYLPTPPKGFTNDTITAITRDNVLPERIQSGTYPNTYQYIFQADAVSPYYSECDGASQFCAIMAFDDVEHYGRDVSASVWIPSCAFDLAESLYVSVEVTTQFYQDNSVSFELAAEQYVDYTLLPPNTAIENSMSGDNWEYHFYRSLQPHVESARWRVVVTDGEGVLVTVRNNRCPLQASWTREVWCDANYFGYPYICDIEIPTEAAHPGNTAYFISVYGKNATYSIAYWRGLENCHAFTHNGLTDGLSFCSGIVNYPTWRWDDYAALDSEASCFFDELYNHFRVQPCWSGVTTDCNATLQQFACYESFRACDANGFYVGTCRSSCDAVVYECVNWFESVDLEHYNCSSSRYIDDGASTCTGSGAWSSLDQSTGLLFGGNPADILYMQYEMPGSSSSLVFSYVLISIFLVLLF